MLYSSQETPTGHARHQLCMSDFERRWDTWPNLIPAVVFLLGIPALLWAVVTHWQGPVPWVPALTILLILTLGEAMFVMGALNILGTMCSDIAFDEEMIESVNAFSHRSITRSIHQIKQVESRTLRTKGIFLGMKYLIKFDHGSSITVTDGRRSTAASEFTMSLVERLATETLPDSGDIRRESKALRQSRLLQIIPMAIILWMTSWMAQWNSRVLILAAIVLALMIISIVRPASNAAGRRQILFVR